MVMRLRQRGQGDDTDEEADDACREKARKGIQEQRSETRTA